MMKHWSSMAICVLMLLGFSHSSPGAESARCYLADGFDYPVGKPNAEGYHKARGFWPNGHLGEDWNGNNGGDTDEGAPIYSMGKGIVVFSEDVHVGWGNCVIIRHVFREASGKIEMVDSLYGHLLERKAKVGQVVDRGQLIGLMGGNSGMYPVHLHFEIRKNLNIGMNRSQFARDYSNYYSPTVFIEAHRQLSSDFKRYEIPVNTFAPYGGELTGDQRTAAGVTSSGTVIRTGKGLSIPVINGSGGYTPGAGIYGGDKKKESTPASQVSPIPSSSAGTPVIPESKDDFWSRLKSKVGSGQVTTGIEEKK
ncbi:MAG: hypothetical protein RL693_287 [Verrucomicrobiota bacterium]|jgi:hypothetical protein